MNLTGRPIEIRYRDHLFDTAGNPAHAATFIRRRLIVLDLELRSDSREHRRILIHELFHFVWVRTGNETRLRWEALLRSEWKAKARGEAGWSAEWRKRELTTEDIARRSRKWREYCCESFCDTAACLETGWQTETTLARSRLAIRRFWFAKQLGDPLPI